MYKKFISIFLILMLSGCYQRREINTLPVVLGLGIDAKDNGVKLTSQVALPANISLAGDGGISSGDDKSPFVNIESDGDYVFPSLRSSSNMLGSRLYLPHNLILIVGEELAKEGIGNYLDIFLRDHEFRPNIYMLVSNGSASDVLSVKSDFDILPSIHISKLIDAQSDVSLGIKNNILNFYECIKSGKRDALLPIIHIIENDNEKTLQLNETAAFAGDMMVGTLDTYETRGYLWATGKVNNTVIMTSVYGRPISVEASRCRAKTNVSLKNGKINLKIVVKLNGNIGSVRGNAAISSNEFVKEIEHETSKTIKSEILSAFKKSIKLKSDFFGVEEMLYRHDLKTYNKIKNFDDLFKNISLDVCVDTHILESGRLVNTL